MIMKQGADTLKRVHFELGGKNPVSSSPMPISTARPMPPSS
jgi:acyl-CoA reductase-like NAD-dependent aldehyde dehydrogenase